jgi:xylulokinase
LLLGLDVGTTRIKAVVIDAAGGERAASVPTPFGRSAEGIDMGVADLRRALGDVLSALGPERERVAAVGLAGMAESGAPMRDGRALAPIIAWHDGRGKETVASLERRFGPALALWTGRRVRTVSSVAKLGWLVDHGVAEPERWLGVPELALFLLTGAEATEYSLAARTGAYDVTERRFLPEVIAHVLAGTHGDGPGAGSRAGAAPEAAGSRAGAAPEAGDDIAAVGGAESGDGRGAALFPPVRAAGEAMGSVVGEAAAEFGLAEGIPVTIAGHDHLAAAAGLGARPDDLFNSVGTAETLVRRLDARPDVARALELDLAVTLWPGGEAWAVLASATRSGLVIEALAAHLERGGSKAGEGMAAIELPVGEVVALGQGIEVAVGPAAEMWAATLGALARRTAAAAERVAALAGPHRRLVVFGGGSRNPAWLQAKAAVVGVPVLRSPVAEATARGAALAAGVAAGWWPTPAAGPIPPLDARPAGLAPWRGQ